MEWEILRLVNIERAKVGVAPLQMTKFTQSVAQIRGQEMLTLYSHTRPDGTSYSTAFEQVLGKRYEPDGPGITVGMGENIAGSRAANPALISAGTFMNAWMNSPPHKENILRPQFKFIGIGVAKDPATRDVYAVQNFAIDGSKRDKITASWGEGAYNNTITNDLNKEHLTVTLEGTYAAAHGAALMPLDYSMVDTANPAAPKINHGVTLGDGTAPDYDIGTNPPGGGGGSATIIKQPDTLFYKNVSIAAVDAMIADANNTQTTTAPFLLIWAWEPCPKSGDAAKYAHKIADENHLPVFVHTTAKVLDVIPENLLVQADVNLETGFSFPIVLYFDGTKWAKKGQWGDGTDGYPAYQSSGKSIAEYLKKNNLLVEKSVFVAKDLEFEVDQPGTALIKMKDYLNYGYEMATQDSMDPDPKKVTAACVKLREEDMNHIGGKEVGFSMVFAVRDGPFGDLSPKAFPTKSSTGFLEYLYGGERIGVTSHFVKIADTAAKLNAAFSGFKAAADPTSTHTLDIRLKADITGPVTIEANNDRSFNLDMNGFSINGGIVHKGTGKLTIKNATNKGAISAADAPAIHVTGAGSVELNGVTVTSAATGSKGTITFDASGAGSSRKLTAKKSTITNTTDNGYAVYLTGATFDKSETTITGKTFPENITVSGNTTLTYMDGLRLSVTVADPHGYNSWIRLCKGNTVLATAKLEGKNANAKGDLTYSTVDQGIPTGETNLTIQLYDQNHVYDTETVKIKMAKREVHGQFKADTEARFNGTSTFEYVRMEFSGGPADAPAYGFADVICSGSALGPQTATTTAMRLDSSSEPWFTIANETVKGSLTVIKGQGLPVSNEVTLRPDAPTALQHTFIDMPPQMGAATYTIGEIRGNVTATVADGVLSITPTAAAKVGETASIPVTVASTNYFNFKVTVKVNLLNKANVSDKITFAGASKTYTGSAITHEGATIAGHTA
ncbi:MAG: CAP domain-containing protein, partial [Anaerovorax sp.]